MMGYFVDSVGINEEIIRRYVRHQEKERARGTATISAGAHKGPLLGGSHFRRW